jgi:uncharacterized protein YbcV (DUF1398 family)
MVQQMLLKITSDKNYCTATTFRGQYHKKAVAGYFEWNIEALKRTAKVLYCQYVLP